MFNAVFNNIKNIVFVSHFISDYLCENYEYVKDNIKLIPRELSVNKKNNSRFQVDILLKHENGNIENIEMNSVFNEFIINRNAAYAFKTYASYYPKNAYSPNTYIPKVRQINICKKVPKELRNNLINECFFTIKDTNKILTKNVEIDIIDMEKAFNSCYNYRNEREEKISRWCRIFNSTDSDEIEKELGYLMNKKDAKDVVNQIKEISSDSEYISLDENFDRTEFDINNAKAEGIEEGIKHEKYNVVKQMLKDKMSLDLISKYTGLTNEEIKKLS